MNENQLTCLKQIKMFAELIQISDFTDHHNVDMIKDLVDAIIEMEE